MKTEMYVPLAVIKPNPYQPREAEDQEHINDLAISIEAQGLLQNPVGRLLDAQGAPCRVEAAYKHAQGDSDKFFTELGCSVELAFGHSRVAAFRYLSDTGNLGYERIPVGLADMTDEEIFQLAIENLKRKNLTQIEEARAMKRYRDDFGKTSEEIGRLFNLSESAVRNKIRLLSLPDEIQKAFSEWTISEGVARELLSLFEISEELRKVAECSYRSKERPSDIVRRAISGSASAEEIREDISLIVKTYGHTLSRTHWKWDDLFDQSGVIGACNNCVYKVQRDKEPFCTHISCFKTKEIAWKKTYLQQASFLTGIPVMEEGEDYNGWTEFRGGDQGSFLAGKEAKCPNLRIVFDAYGDNYSDPAYNPGSLKKTGFPLAKIVCKKRKGFCTCTQAVKAGVKVETAKAPAEEPVVDESQVIPSPKPVKQALTTDDIVEIARQARRQKRENMAEIAAMREECGKRIAEGLVGDNPAIWAFFCRYMVPSGFYKVEKELNIQNNWMNAAEELRFILGRTIAGMLHNEYDADPGHAMEDFNRFLSQARLRILESVSAETEVEYAQETI